MLSSRLTQQVQAPSRRTASSRVSVRIQASATQVPANVAEARAWIAEWRSQQAAPAAPAASVPANVAEARDWIAKWRAQQNGKAAAATPAAGAAPMAAASTEVPANVAEARAWIAGWRAQQQSAPAATHTPAPKAAEAPAPAAHAPAPKAAAPAAPANAAAPAGSKFDACKTTPDGTLVFRSTALSQVSYQEVFDAASKKESKK